MDIVDTWSAADLQNAAREDASRMGDFAPNDGSPYIVNIVDDEGNYMYTLTISKTP